MSSTPRPEVFWRLPLAGDGRSVATARWHRGDFSRERTEPHPFARTGVQRDGYTYYDLLLQIGRAAELAGFDGVWIPDSPGGEEPLIVAGSLAREVPRLRLIPTLRAALLSAVYSAKIAVSFQRLTGGRLAWFLTTAEESEGQRWHGRNWSESEQVQRTAEFLHVAKGFWHDPPFTFQGRFYEVVSGGFDAALQGESFPTVYLAGTSDEALALSAEHADVHLFPLLPVPELRSRIERLQQLAGERGRTLRFGLEADVIARHTDAEAWAEAEREWDVTRAKTVPISAAVPHPSQGSFAETRGAGSLWSGFGRLRPGPELGVVGGYREVTDTLAEYLSAGVSTLVLGAYPHIEEAYSLGEHVLPFLGAAEADSAGAVRVAS